MLPFLRFYKSFHTHVSGKLSSLSTVASNHDFRMEEYAAARVKHSVIAESLTPKIAGCRTLEYVSLRLNIPSFNVQFRLCGVDLTKNPLADLLIETVYGSQSLTNLR